MHKPALLSYILTLAFSTVFVQALIFGYESAGMRGVFIASAIAYIPLGVFVGIIWSPNLSISSTLAGIPAWLFIFALHQWSVTKALTAIVEGVPLVLEPISVSVFFYVGGWIGKKLFTLRKQRTRVSAQS